MRWLNIVASVALRETRRWVGLCMEEKRETVVDEIHGRWCFAAHAFGRRVESRVRASRGRASRAYSQWNLRHVGRYRRAAQRRGVSVRAARGVRHARAGAGRFLESGGNRYERHRRQDVA